MVTTNLQCWQPTHKSMPLRVGLLLAPIEQLTPRPHATGSKSRHQCHRIELQAARLVRCQTKHLPTGRKCETRQRESYSHCHDNITNKLRARTSGIEELVQHSGIASTQHCRSVLCGRGDVEKLNQVVTFTNDHHSSLKPDSASHCLNVLMFGFARTDSSRLAR